MKIKGKEQIVRKLGKDERYNTCPRCGCEASLYFDDQKGEYCIECVNCESDNTMSYCTYVPSLDDLDIARVCWNFEALGDRYSPNVLKELKAQNGEYLVADASDGFIVFAGNQEGLYDFLTRKSKTGDHKMYSLHNVQNGKLYNIGLSILVDLTLKHYKVER